MTKVSKSPYGPLVVIQRSGPVEGSPAEGAVFTTVLTSGSLSRADIARRTGLSSAAVTRAAKPLIAAGFLESAEAMSADPDETRMGRPSLPLRVRALHTGALGIKVTREEVIGVVCDLSGAPRVSDRLPLPNAEVSTAVDAIADLYSRLIAASSSIGFIHPPLHLGISLSGDVDHATGYVRYSPFLGWRDVDLGAQVAARIAAPVVVALMSGGLRAA